MINFRKIFFVTSTLIISGFIWWLILLFITLPKKYYSTKFPDTSDDVGIIVLTGGKMRIEKGIEILQKGYATKMFISGVFMPSEIQVKLNYEKNKKDLLECCIFFGEEARNTIENAVEVRNWLIKNKEIDKIILVTSYYHLPRSILIFEKKLRNISILAKPAVDEVNVLDEPTFHLRLIVSEYFKVIYSLIFVR